MQEKIFLYSANAVRLPPTVSRRIGCIVFFIPEPVSRFLPALQDAFFAEDLTPFVFDQRFLDRMAPGFEGNLITGEYCSSPKPVPALSSLAASDFPFAKLPADGGGGPVF